LILDTNALSALAEGVLAAGRGFLQARALDIPVIVLGEFRFGAAQSRNRSEYERWLERLVSISRVLVIDDDTAFAYAQIRVELREAGTPIPANDTWIAALCRQHQLPLLSRDRHFDRVVGLRRVGW
jgi:tRNA(fMet)-specific endonuclease VapC